MDEYETAKTLNQNEPVIINRACPPNCLSGAVQSAKAELIREIEFSKAKFDCEGCPRLMECSDNVCSRFCLWWQNFKKQHGVK